MNNANDLAGRQFLGKAATIFRIEYFRSGKANYPVERTLLVTGILAALHDSRAADGKRVKTPHLEKVKFVDE